ncbi:MAG: ATP-binding cassette domain-containing protein [Desulfatibacillum sp.]|nr:ATP-binding cassette domain-containing protein [Desulfatibacillum sp.]
MNNHHILECRDVGFAYEGGKEIFSDVNLRAPAGAFVQIQGASGTGKSTFLRLLNRLAAPSSGTILHEGRDLQEYSPPALRTRIIYLQQTPSVVQGSVRHNLLLPFGFAANKELAVPSDQTLSQGLSRFLLEGVHLDDLAFNLSVGQRQRLCLLRAILLSPRIMLLDEPTSALDKDSRLAVEQIVNRLCKEDRITMFLVAHTEFAVEAETTLHCTLARGRMEVQ